MPDKPFEVCADVEGDDTMYQVISRHTSRDAAERALRKFESENGRDAWVEPGEWDDDE